MLNEIYDQVAKELGLESEVVKAAYQAQWQFIRNTIEELPLKEELSEEEFSRLRTSFNLPSLGKIYTTNEKVKRAKRRVEYLKKLMANAKT